MRDRLLILLLCLWCVLGSAAGQSLTEVRYIEYINTYKDLAIEQMLRYNIPASITLAQGLLESGAGYSRLARQGNNHFGIKCHDWRGRTIYEDDDARHECFRAYKTVRDSYEDHSLFLTTGRRYSSLFYLSRTDYKGWARGLKAAGYATSPTYANSLISIIERYGLAQYDRATKYNKFIVQHEGKMTPMDDASYSRQTNGYHPIYMTNRNYFLIAREGDTFKGLSQETGVKYTSLAKYNERNKNDVLSEGDIVYLQKKRNKADKVYKNVPHIVEPGESMYSIAQKYGITLEALYKLNHLGADYTISVGDKLRVY